MTYKQDYTGPTIAADYLNSNELQVEVKVAESEQKDPLPKLRWYQNYHFAPGHSNFWALCPYVFFVCSVNYFDESVLPLALQLIYEDLGITYSQAYWLGTSYYLGTAATSIPLSKIGQMYGAVKVTYILLFITFALYLAAFFIKNFIALVIIRAFIGATTSGFLSSRNVFVSAYPSDERRAYSVAYTLVLRMVQQVIYPSIGSLIINAGGWKYVHLMPALLIIVSMLFLIPFSEKKAEKQKRFDIGGSVTLAVVLCSFALCFTFLTFKYWIAAGCLAGLFIIFTVLFFYVEKRVENPVLPLGLLRNPFVDVLVCNILNFCNTISLQFVIPKVLRLFNFSEYIIGVITSCGAACGVIATFLNNFASKRVVSRILVPSMYGCVLVAMALFCSLMKYKYPTLVFYFLYIFFSMGLQQHTYGLLLTCVPRALTSYVAGFPPLSRTFGSSLASCLNQGIFEIVSDVNGGVEKVRESSIIVVCFYMAIVVMNTCLSAFRFGNNENESAKLGFKTKAIRLLKFAQDNQE